MDILRTVGGQYLVLNKNKWTLFSNLRNAISFIRMCNQVPVYIIS